MDEIIEIVDIKTYCHGKTAAVDLSMWFHNIGKRPDGIIAERMMLHDDPRLFIDGIVTRAKCKSCLVALSAERAAFAAACCCCACCRC
jgi:hypothetical protein